MISILKVEFFRLKKSKLFWTMFALCLALPILTALLMMFLAAILSLILDVSPSLANYSELLKEMSITNALLSDFADASCISAFLAMITSSVVLSKEFSEGTVRNVILANKSRAQLYFSYLFTSLIIGTIFMMCSFTTTMLVAAPTFGFGGISAKDAVAGVFCSLLLGLLATAFVQSCVCMFLFGVRKQWAAILFPILVVLFAPSLFAGLTSILTFVYGAMGKVFPARAAYWIPFANVSYYNSGSLIGEVVGAIILYYAVFITVFIVSGYYTFKKADLK